MKHINCKAVLQQNRANKIHQHKNNVILNEVKDLKTRKDSSLNAQNDIQQKNSGKTDNGIAAVNKIKSVSDDVAHHTGCAEACV